jgi:tyrosine-specific transport protein
LLVLLFLIGRNKANHFSIDILHFTFLKNLISFGEKFMHSKLIGSSLLIIGTSIGAGILGLPIAAAQLGFIGSVILLFLCWFIMTSGALLILEVNLSLLQNNNIISMAKATIGPVGQLIAWTTYLLLLYSLLCAYIAGGSDLFHNLLQQGGFNIPSSVTSVIFTVLFGSVVYLGIQSVDKVNRVLITVKMGAFLLVIFLLFSFIKPHQLIEGDLHHLTSLSAISVTMSAFGWSTLIPSLRTYFGNDIVQLKKAILIGSTVPLICYIAWDAVIMGVIPLHGEQGLVSVLESGNAATLVNILNVEAGSSAIHLFTKIFTSICVLTSFLGVALCLTDFFADGFIIEKKGLGKIGIHAITFIPALGISIFFPHAFITALSCAGIYSTILLILLPAWMVLKIRYRLPLKKDFTLAGGKVLLSILIFCSLGLVIATMIQLIK